MKGLLYIEIHYPGYLSLKPKEWYTFTFNGKLVGVAIEEHVDALNLINFRSQLQNGMPTKPTDFNSKSILRISYKIEPLGIPREATIDPIEETIAFTQFYTTIIIAYETIAHNKSYKDESLYSDILSYFISRYRAISGDIPVRQLRDITDNLRFYTRRCFHKYQKEEFALPAFERLVKPRDLNMELMMLKFHGLVESAPHLNNGEIDELTNKLLWDLAHLPSSYVCNYQDTVIAIAEAISINKNYKFALLEAFTACEQLLVKSLRDIKLQRGVSKKKLDDYEKEMK